MIPSILRSFWSYSHKTTFVFWSFGRPDCRSDRDRKGVDRSSRVEVVIGFVRRSRKFTTRQKSSTKQGGASVSYKSGYSEILNERRLLTV